jgi:hypothetical protein
MSDTTVAVLSEKRKRKLNLAGIAVFGTALGAGVAHFVSAPKLYANRRIKSHRHSGYALYSFHLHWRQLCSWLQ